MTRKIQAVQYFHPMASPLRMVWSRSTAHDPERNIPTTMINVHLEDWMYDQGSNMGAVVRLDVP